MALGALGRHVDVRRGACRVAGLEGVDDGPFARPTPVRERLQKILARAGYGSRRTAEALIRAGRVRVNGVAVTRLGAQTDPVVDTIEVDGGQIPGPGAKMYLVMNKPAGHTTTTRDPHAARTVMQLLPDGLPPDVVPAGRLDRDTEGLLIFTNDGELAHRLAHPRFEIEKEYYALVRGAPSAAALNRLRQGVINLDGRRTRCANVAVAAAPAGYHNRDDDTWLQIVIHEGRKRQVRRMCDAIGHPVRVLVRTRIGCVRLARLRRGGTRPLSRRELRELRDLIAG